MSKGEYTVTVDKTNSIIRVVASGDFDKPLGDKMITETRTTAGKYGFNIFCDATKAKVKVPVIEWFLLPRTLPILQDQKIRTIKAAVLIPKGVQEENYKFYENVTHNVGMNLKVFLNEEEAIKWLKAKSK